MHYHCTSTAMRRQTQCPSDDCTQSVLPLKSLNLITDSPLLFPLPPSLPPTYDRRINRAWLPSTAEAGFIGLSIGPNALSRNGADHPESEEDE